MAAESSTSRGAQDAEPFWAIVEIMGHRRLAGQVSEQVVAGHAFVRVDVPASKRGEGFTQLFNGSSIYCITPTTAATARAAAESFSERPLVAYDLPATRALSHEPHDIDLPDEESDDLDEFEL